LLLLPQEAAEPATPRQKAAPPIPFQPNATGRVVVGAILALGLYLGLRKLTMGAVLAATADADAWWNSFDGLLVVCCGQVMAVVFGAIVAAAGRAGGFVFGSAVGAVCGVLFLGAELLGGAPARDLVLYVQLVVLVLVGGIAGVLAARVWGAVPILDMPIPSRNRLSSSRFALETDGAIGRPTAWLRILAGAMIMLLAVAAAEQVRSGAQKYSGGALRVYSIGQGQFLTWQIAILGVLGGGVLAGAGTGAGIRHGLISGALGGVGVIGLTAMHGAPLSPVSYWLNKIALGEAASNDPYAIGAALGGVLFLGFLGGWLGGTLFLPLAPDHMRSRLRTGLE
jgi:hypothetical protein